MMKKSCLLLASSLIGLVSGAFDGMGRPYSEPYCAFACRAVTSSAPLQCSEPMDHQHGGMGHHGPMTTPECRASDDAFLTTLAFCIKTRCVGVALGDIENYWLAQTTGDPSVPAKWNYATTLLQIRDDPETVWIRGEEINSTVVVPQEVWDVQRKFIPLMEVNSHVMFKYSIVLLVVGFGLPIVTTLFSTLPLASTLVDKINPYLTYPSTIGTYQVRPLPWLLGNAPTLAQTLYIVIFVILNIVLSCIDYTVLYPLVHPWGYDRRGEILAYAGYRTGEFAFALLPLTILFAGRNNILLWLTNWSHSTYLLLHRWVARVFTIQTILHSVFLLAARIQTGTYKADEKLSYWQWGIVGTVACSAMLVFSMLWIRRWSYEVFLIGHIIMAVLTVVGSWYHLILRFGKTGSHEYWLYAAFAVWAFDRFFRIFRIVKNGARRATVTEIGDYHVRVDIPGINFNNKPGYHGYVYFPAINPLRPWENHPFSVNSTRLLHYHKHHSGASSSTDTSGDSIGHEQEKVDIKNETTQIDNVGSSHSVHRDTDGITLYIRKSNGMTKSLKAHYSFLALLDGPYPNNPTEEVLSCDRLLLIGGGIGITGLLGFLHAHINIKLAWSVKSAHEPLARELTPVFEGVDEKVVRVGERLDVDGLLRLEAEAGYKRVGVVVCGPGGLCDDVRAKVAGLARHGKTTFVLEVDAFSW